MEKPEDLRSIVLGPIYSLRFYQIKAMGRKLDHISLKLVLKITNNVSVITIKKKNRTIETYQNEPILFIFVENSLKSW